MSGYFPYPRNDVPLTDRQLSTLPYFREDGLFSRIGLGVTPPIRQQGQACICCIFGANTAISVVLAVQDRGLVIAARNNPGWRFVEGRGWMFVDGRNYRGWRVVELSVRQIRDYTTPHPAGGYDFRTIFRHYCDVGVSLEEVYYYLENAPRYSARIYPIPFPRVTLDGAYIHHEGPVDSHIIDYICDYIYAYGAVVAMIDVTPEFRRFVGEGIYRHPPNATFLRGRHGFAMVGFNRRLDYWLVPNSWGPRLGYYGYLKLHFSCVYGFAVPFVPRIVFRF